MNGPRRIKDIIPEVLASLGISSHQEISAQNIGDALDILGERRDFEKMPIENKLNVAATFSQIDICETCKTAYLNAVRAKLDPDRENKPAEYFSNLEENVRRVRKFSKEQEAAYLSRRKE